LLAVFIEAELPDDTALPAVEAALLEETERLNTAGDPRQLLGLQPHLRAVSDRAQERTDDRAASLCNDLGVYLYTIGVVTTLEPGPT
jgi:hypothetical protein